MAQVDALSEETPVAASSSTSASSNDQSASSLLTDEPIRDTLILYSTQEGFVTYRDPDDGNYAAQLLMKTISNHSSLEIKEVIQKFKQEYERLPMFGCVPECRDLGLSKSYYMNSDDHGKGKGIKRNSSFASISRRLSIFK